MGLWTRSIRIACLAALALVGAISCGRADPPGLETLDEIRERGELIVLTLESPTTYHLDEDGEPEGYEVALVQNFAQDLGVSVRFEPQRDLGQLLANIAAGQGHLAAGGVTITEARREAYTFGPAYKTVTEQLVCRRGGPQVRSIEDMADVEIAVLEGSSYIETLQALKVDHPGIHWRTVNAPSALPLLELVQAEQVDCTVSDSTIVAHARLRYPELLTPLVLSEERSLAFVLPLESALSQPLNRWSEARHEGDLLERLDQRWFGVTRQFDYVDTARFIRRIEERLPAFRPHFEAAAEASGIDWRWLAAQAYQESHWDPDAVSATGVRGIMMLTLPTANELGVEDRTDPAQSIEGGARYLANLMERLPEEVQGRDRLFLALSAYNVGMGHLYDARRLAERQSLEKNRWGDIRKVLPLLSDPDYYTTVPRGYARGREPVQYVANIRRYRVLLDLHLDE
jgi:membrane-bound lytic murein transglycosylase F